MFWKFQLIKMCILLLLLLIVFYKLLEAFYSEHDFFEAVWWKFLRLIGYWCLRVGPTLYQCFRLTFVHDSYRWPNWWNSQVTVMLYLRAHILQLFSKLWEKALLFYCDLGDRILFMFANVWPFWRDTKLSYSCGPCL